MDWLSGRTEVKSGFVAYDDCFRDRVRGTCVETVIDGELTLSAQAIETEVRLESPVF